MSEAIASKEERLAAYNANVAAAGRRIRVYRLRPANRWTR